MSVQETSDADDDARADEAWFETRPPATRRGPCKRHPVNTSSFTCERCGDYRCEDCRRTLGIRDLCPACHALAAREESASYWSISAAVFGFWGLGCAPVGWIGVVLGAVALALALREGRRGGRMLAAAGIVFGIAGTVLFVLALSLAIADPLPEPAYDDTAWGPP